MNTNEFLLNRKTEDVDGNHRKNTITLMNKSNGKTRTKSWISRKDIAFIGLQKEFDIEKSRRLYPPLEFYIGCKHYKRLVVAIEDIIIEEPETGETLQSREQINVVNNWKEIKRSFKYRGWLHNEQPLFVQKDKGSNKRFLLRSGFNRITAAKELGWKYIIVDVYEDAAAASDQILFKYVVNNDNLPSAPNRDVDFVKGAVEAIDKKVVSQTSDNEIVEFLKKLTCTSEGVALKTPTEIVEYKPSWINDDGEVVDGDLKTSCLLYKVRRKRGKEAHIVPLDGTEANKRLRELVRGFAGAGLVTAGLGSELGYAFEEKNSLHRILWDGLKLWVKYQKPIMLYGYIENPSSMTLDADRASCKEHYNEFLEEAKRKIYATVNFDKIGVKNISQVPWNIEEIFKWGGYIPQDETIQGDKKKETDII